MYGYRRVFSWVGEHEVLGPQALQRCLSVQADGQLMIQLGNTAHTLDLGANVSPLSTPLFIGNSAHAATPNGAYTLEVDARPVQDAALGTDQQRTEFWLIHTDFALNRLRNAKLNTEVRGTINAFTPAPMVSAAPSGRLFMVDDGGIVRLYAADNLHELGAFQVAQPGTDNRVVALAIAADEKLVAGLSRWKTIVLYNIEERRVHFARQIQDELGWYAHFTGLIVTTRDTEAIVTIGAAPVPSAPARARYALNIFSAAALAAAT